MQPFGTSIEQVYWTRLATPSLYICVWLCLNDPQLLHARFRTCCLLTGKSLEYGPFIRSISSKYSRVFVSLFAQVVVLFVPRVINPMPLYMSKNDAPGVITPYSRRPFRPQDCRRALTLRTFHDPPPTKCLLKISAAYEQSSFLQY